MFDQILATCHSKRCSAPQNWHWCKMSPQKFGALIYMYTAILHVRELSKISYRNVLCTCVLLWSYHVVDILWAQEGFGLQWRSEIEDGMATFRAWFDSERDSFNLCVDTFTVMRITKKFDATGKLARVLAHLTTALASWNFLLGLSNLKFYVSC